MWMLRVLLLLLIIVVAQVQSSEMSDVEKSERKSLKDFLSQVHATCDQAEQKAEEDKARVDQTMVIIKARAKTTVKLLKEYNIYDRVETVQIMSNANYQTHWSFDTTDYELVVANGGDENGWIAHVTGRDFLFLGSIRDGVRLLAALLKAPEPR